jgi:uncharacterized 2Fe-2S/4Fe-4S cluster protein (DUF4445 family)
MSHLLTGVNPKSIRLSPYVPAAADWPVIRAADLGITVKASVPLLIYPSVSSYVGGDIVAGVLASGLYKQPELSLFIDVGTNGEIVVGNQDWMTCAACSAGPAFEGGGVKFGMRAAPGAIEQFYYDAATQTHRLTVIGKVKPIGICGSGLIDALAALLSAGVVTEPGRLLPPDLAPENVAHHIKRMDDGKTRFYFTEDVYLSVEDVRQLQLAKAAIRAGVDTLLALRGETYDNIDTLLIAGGFGAFMDVRSACTIGLLPPAMVNKTRHVGNAAGGGAALALDPEKRGLLTELTAKCDYHELSSSRIFMDKYIECMIFDEMEDVE